jgi:STE24 endopeptidase
VNESRSSRYHRRRRRAGAAQAVIGAALLIGLMASGVSARLRDAVGGSVLAYGLVLVVLYEALTFPLIWYRGHRLERMFELSKVTFVAWLRDYVKTAALTLVLALAAAEFMYFAMSRWPGRWWLISAVAGALLAGSLTVLAPVWLLPMFHRIRPLDRDRLRLRLQALSRRAGVSVLGVHEWALGCTSTRANAALVGAGGTRRILVSDTLLADYTDDEIEVVLAHEIGHHVHHDMMQTLIAELAVLAGSLWLASASLTAWSTVAGRSWTDVSGLPIVALTIGVGSLLSRPLLNALSRRNERRADRFALELTGRPAAFIAAVRRIAAQNLVEEHPSPAAYVIFHTHPTPEERMRAAASLIPCPLSQVSDPHP